MIPALTHGILFFFFLLHHYHSIAAPRQAISFIHKIPHSLSLELKPHLNMPTEAQIAGGHKANLNNPNTSKESKEHSKQILDEQFNGGDGGRALRT